MRSAPFFLLALAVAAPPLLPAVLAQSTIEHVHLALSDVPGEAVVVWRSPASVPATVEYGPTEEYGETVEGEGSPEPGAGGVVFAARISGLAPGERYRFRILQQGFGFEGGGFRVDPGRSGNATFTAWGDHGTDTQYPEAAANVENALELSPDLHLHTGDLSYANGVPAIWDRWFTMIQPLASTSYYMPAIGNHEIEPTQGLERDAGASVEPLAYMARFVLPSNERWYSFDYGPLHVVSIDTESPLEEGSEQRTWIAQDLDSDRAKSAGWRVAFFHRSAYSSNANHGSFAPATSLDPVFDDGGVDLVLTGHDHDYERTYPLRGGDVRSSERTAYAAGTGTIHVRAGGGGAPLYETYDEPQPEWSVVRRAVHHLLRVEASPAQLSGQAIALDGEVFDAFTIRKTQEEPPAPPPPPPSEPQRTPGIEEGGIVALLFLVATRRKA